MATAIRTSPKPPVSVTATAVITSTANATAHLRVEWPAPPTQPQPVSALNLYRNGVLLGTLPSSTRSYTDAVAVAGVSYSYAVTVVSITTSESPPRSSASAPRMPRRPLWAANTPTSRTMAQGDQFSFAGYGSHQDGLAVTYGLVSPPTGYSMTSGGVLTSGGASSTLTLRLTASNGLYADHTFAVTVSQTGSAATYVIPASTSARTLNGGSASGWSAFGPARAPTGGDIIELAAGNHGTLIFNNLTGTSSDNRITVRNGSGQVVITSSATNAVEYSGCQYVDFVFDNAGQAYGLKIQATSASAAFDKGIKAEGDNSYVRWAYVEIDGRRTSWTSAVQPIGFFGHHQYTTRSGGLFQQDHIVVDHCYIHHMAGEGIYFGPNYSNGSRPLRNIEVAHNLITDCGRDGFQGKCFFEGTNSVHDNEVWRCGRNTADTQAGQRFGLSINSGKADFYNNKIYESGESGIQVFTQNGPGTSAFSGYGPYSSFDCEIYNNLIVDSGVIDNAPVNTGHGITLGAGDATYCLPRGYVYNNTVVGSEGDGISFGSNTNAGWIRNNVLLNNAGGAYSAGTSSASNNKTTGSVNASYRLTSEDAAVGSIGTDISATDLDGVSRAGTASKGCYEYA